MTPQQREKIIKTRDEHYHKQRAETNYKSLLIPVIMDELWQHNRAKTSRDLYALLWNELTSEEKDHVFMALLKHYGGLDRYKVIRKMIRLL